MASRAEVYRAIDSERDHQDRIGLPALSTLEGICVMEEYLLRARANRICSTKPPLDELDNIRKVVAVGVQIMEQHGAPLRIRSKANPLPEQEDE